ncbi:MAG TPA: carboxypeptidase-like regulatory domain-containing protein [Thermoanaerobaculia bacterium]
MTTRSERLNRLVISSPCEEAWQVMNGDERARFCSRCQKHVYDLAALEAREIDALIEATQGRLCARITRDRSGRMVTREPDAPPFHVPVPARRVSPVVAAVVTAVVGLTGAAWAEAPAPPPAAAAPATPHDQAHPSGPGGAVLGGRTVDDHGFALPGTTILLRHSKEGWKFYAVTDAQGWFQFRDLPSGVYDVEAELEGFEFKTRAGLKLGPKGRQVTFTGTPSEIDILTVLTGETGMPYLPMDMVFQQSHVVVVATVGPSVTLREPKAGDVVRQVRTELWITSVLKGEPRGSKLLIDRHVIPGQPGDLQPGAVVLALLNPLGPGDGRPDSLVYLSADPIYALRSLPADPRLRPELGVDEAAWQAMSFIANETNNPMLRDLVTRSITQVEEARQQHAGSSLQARTAAIEKELRRRFVEVLSPNSED